jgi:NAD-dependent deacetylase
MINKEIYLYSDFNARIEIIARWMFESQHLVVFTGAGISTESGLPDFRGPDGIWTRKAMGLPTLSKDFSIAEPNAGHFAIVDLQNMSKLQFLISQNVDNLHLKSGIHPELIAELHGNITKIRCVSCEFCMDNFDDNIKCPLCGSQMKPSVVDFGQTLPQKDLELATQHSQHCDLFIVVGSSLLVNPAADLPRVAVAAGAKLVIINQGSTAMDAFCDLRFSENANQVLPPAIEHLNKLMKNDRKN